MNVHSVIISAAIFIVVYLLITSGKINRTVAVIMGAMFMISLKIIPQQKAFQYVDWNVIFLLISMMMLVAVIENTGLLQYVAIKSVKLARGEPYRVMFFLILITALFSALLDNVTTVVLIAPITILIARELDISPVPFLIADALASNIGGTATLIGDPPNIMIGSAAHLSFIAFLENLAPIIIIMIIGLPFIMKLLLGNKMVVSYERKARIMEFDTSRIIPNKSLLKKSLIIFSLVIIGFFIHGFVDLEVATIAMTGAFILILSLGNQKETLRELFSKVEWPSIFFFVGFFIMVGGLVEVGIIKTISIKLSTLFGKNMPLASLITLWFSGIISSIFDNVPFVATMIPVIKDIGAQWGAQGITPIWWALSLGACLGGNITIIGAAANVVVADIADKNGYPISFWEFFKYGSLVTILNLLISSFYIWFRYFVMKV